MLPQPRSRRVEDGCVITEYWPVSAPAMADVLAEIRQPPPRALPEEVKPRCPCGFCEGACDGSCEGF